jgi:hypothetical protein
MWLPQKRLWSSLLDVFGSSSDTCLRVLLALVRAFFRRVTKTQKMTTTTMTTTFDECVPTYGMDTIYVPNIKSHLHNGTFVELCEKDNGNSKQQFGCIVRRAAAQDCVVVNMFVTREELDVSSSLPIEVAGVSAGVKELFQTNKCRQFSAIEIQDVVFVFHPHRMEREGIAVEGISFAYVCKYREDGKALLEYRSFPSDSEDLHLKTSYASSIFSSFVAVQTVLHKALNKTGETQGIKSLDRLSVPSHFFLFLLRKFPIAIIETNSKVRVNRLVYKLKKATFSYKVPSCMLRFETHADLALFRSIFGAHSTHGTRNKAPSGGARAIALLENGSLNVISGNEARPEKFVFYTNKTGVDMAYNTEGTLEVRTRYDHIRYRTDRGTGVPRCDLDEHGIPSYIATLLGVTPEDNGDTTMGPIVVGASFICNGVLFVVSSVDTSDH